MCLAIHRAQLVPLSCKNMEASNSLEVPEYHADPLCSSSPYLSGHGPPKTRDHTQPFCIREAGCLVIFGMCVVSSVSSTIWLVCMYVMITYIIF